ncbi:MAG: hypothetical protein ACREM1_08010 [Longimicrobiales bacterium]
MKVERLTRLGAFALAAALAAAPESGAAQQDYAWAAGFYGGGMWFSPLNDGGNAPAALELDPGWVAGVQGEHWFSQLGGHVGMRVNGEMTRRPLPLPGETRDIGVWMLDAGLMVRLLPPTQSTRFNVFLSAGGGVVRYRLGDGPPRTFVDANARYAGDEAARWAAVGGVGFDIITGSWWDEQPVGVRVEAVDHMVFDSPFDPLDGETFSPIHNVRLAVGLLSGFGVLR